MRYLLNIIYLMLIAVWSPCLLYAALRHGKYRQGLAQKLLGRVPRRENKNPCIWMHAVSVGEVNLLSSILQRVQRQMPGCDCVISTTTKSAFEFARKKYADYSVFYCPLDFSWAVDTAMGRVRPSVLMLVELELWPNLLASARRNGVRVAVVNGRLSESSFRGYRRVRFLTRGWLDNIQVIAAQSPLDAQRFQLLGAAPQRVHVTGSVKFDGAQTDPGNPRTAALARLAGFHEHDLVFLAGSTQHPEEQLAIEAFRQLVPAHPCLRLVLVPRHPERFDAVASLLKASGLAWQRRSQLDQRGADPAARALLVDTVGELGAWWGTARIAFVGGSLGTRGGQNMIEPAAYGVAVSFGPKTRNFRDIVSALLDADAAVVIRDGDELAGFVRRCLDEPEYRQALGARARQLVLESAGAADQTADLLHQLVGPSSVDFSQHSAAERPPQVAIAGADRNLGRQPWDRRRTA